MAPLWQGAEQHSLTSTSQNSPVKPGGQLRKHIIVNKAVGLSPTAVPSLLCIPHRIYSLLIYIFHCEEHILRVRCSCCTSNCMKY